MTTRMIITRIFGRLKRIIQTTVLPQKLTNPQTITHREMVKRLQLIPHWEQKMEFYNRYEYSVAQSVWLENRSSGQGIKAKWHADDDILNPQGGVARVNYGCGENLKEGWLNVDLYPFDAANYKLVNLLEKHPFPNESVHFGFSEDVLEHLTQAESIFFISEIFRTLVVGGVLRLSFPGLEGVILRHYSPPSELRIRQGEFEAYTFWDHVHFYSKEEISLLASHIGFTIIEFVECGHSKYPELCGLDTRLSQIGLNTYVELTK